MDVPHQISSYWHRPHETVSSSKPEWMPTGAVLPRAGESLSNGAAVLDLVSIDYVWFSLSMAGIHAHATELL